MTRVADYIADYLVEVGVDCAFLLSGGGMMHVLDAVSRRMSYICCHHEQACAMAAEAYARQRQGLGLCLGTSGPGGPNLVTGIVGAWQDSTPMVCLTGQTKLSQTIRGSGLAGLRQFGFLEVDIVPIVESVTKYAVFVDDPQSIRYHLEKAVHLATTGRPGPVLLDLPLDIQGAPIDVAELVGYVPEPEPAAVDPATVTAVLERLMTAERPLLLGGHGLRCAGVAELFAALVEQLNVPVVTTALAKDLLPYETRRFVGHPGTRGDRPANFAVQNADVLVSLGSSLHVTTTGWEAELFAPTAYKVMVDPDPIVHQRVEVEVQEKICCDLKVFVTALLEQASARGLRRADGSWQARTESWKTRYEVRLEPHKQEPDGINYYRFVDALSELLTGDETVVADAGLVFYVLGQIFRARPGQRVILSGALATMGYTLPACVGAAAAAPERMIIGITGDGSLQTNVHVLQTIAHHQQNIKLFVVNNDGYLSIRNTQRTFFAGHEAGSSPASGVSLPPMDKLAEAYSLPYAKVSQDDLAGGLAAVLATPGPVLCEILASRNLHVMPGVASVQLPDGRMRSGSLHEMSPVLDAAELAEIMTNDVASSATSTVPAD